MKKYICLVLVLTLMLSGCKFVKGEDVTSSSNTTKNNTPNSNIQIDDEWTPPNLKDQVTSSSSEIIPPAPLDEPVILIDGMIKLSSDDKIKINSYDTKVVNSINSFLDALLKNDVKKIEDLLIPKFYNPNGTQRKFNENMYDFFKDIKIDKIELLNYTFTEDNYDFTSNVNIIVSQSSTNMFKIGNNEWTVSYNNYYGIVNFYSKNKQKDFYYPDLPDLTKRSHYIANYYTNFNDFRTTTVFDKIVTKENSWFHDYMLFYIATYGIKDSTALYVDVNACNVLKGNILREYIERVLGVKNYDLSTSNQYNKNNDTLTLLGGGGWGFINKLTNHNYDEKTRTLTIELDFYADYIYLVKAKTMRYQFYVDNEENLKLVSMENIYNSDYNIATWSS